MDNLLNVSSSPHIKTDANTRSIMIDVIISLIPCICFGVYVFGQKALLIIIVSTIAAVLSEFLFDLITRRKNSIFDFSAIVTGILLGLNMPVSVDLFIPILGSIFAIIVVKMLFGGLGQNFMNPALCGRAFLAMSFASYMNNFTYDGITAATPLNTLRQGINIDLIDTCIGFIPGTIGEVSTIAILIGFIYLLIKRIIDYRIPFFSLFTFLIFILLFSGNASNINYVVGQVISGGLLFGIVFMATDYVTSPVTNFGKVLYGVFLGVMFGIFRLYGKSTEGVTYSILIGNLLVPFIEKITINRPFGRESA